MATAHTSGATSGCSSTPPTRRPRPATLHRRPRRATDHRLAQRLRRTGGTVQSVRPSQHAADGGAGNSRRFQYPYHAWTYADDGRLLAAPFAPELDPTTHGLDVCRVDEWHGLVLATMHPEPRPLRNRLAHIEHEVVAAGIDGFHHWRSQRRSEEWAANWKLVIANAMESYHLFKVHPATLEPYSPTSGAFDVGGLLSGGQRRRHRSRAPR